MKEQDFIKIITNEIGTEYIGDDCAYLKELDIVVTQDSMVEDIHFKKEWYTPKQLGYKAVAVNISDVLASGAKPAYVSIALSLPPNIDNSFIEEFYMGAKSALCGAKIIGGDITGSTDKIFISITAIGKADSRNISSRKNAKPEYKIITRGQFGKSSLGLNELFHNGNNLQYINAHIAPFLDLEFSTAISTQLKCPYAMMDTSDGLADALYKIAELSNVSITTIEKTESFGSEDYILIAAIPKEFQLRLPNIRTIGFVEKRKDYIIKINDKKYNNYDDLNIFNHFGGNNE